MVAARGETDNTVLPPDRSKVCTQYCNSVSNFLARYGRFEALKFSFITLEILKNSTLISFNFMALFSQFYKHVRGFKTPYSFFTVVQIIAIHNLYISSA